MISWSGSGIPYFYIWLVGMKSTYAMVAHCRSSYGRVDPITYATSILLQSVLESSGLTMGVSMEPPWESPLGRSMNISRESPWCVLRESHGIPMECPREFPMFYCSSRSYFLSSVCSGAFPWRLPWRLSWGLPWGAAWRLHESLYGSPHGSSSKYAKEPFELWRNWLLELP